MTAYDFMDKFVGLWTRFQDEATDSQTAEARDALQDWLDDNFGLDFEDDDDDDDEDPDDGTDIDEGVGYNYRGAD